MEKTRFAIISALFRLSKIIGRSLKLAESLASGKVEDEAGNKDIGKNIRREMKTVPALLNEVREYIAEHDDKELAHQFVRLHGDAKRLHDLCSAYLQDLGKEALYAGIVYTSIEVIGQYFFPDGNEQREVRSMTRIEATDCIDTIRTAIRKCTAETGVNKGKEYIGKEAYALLADMDKEKIEAVKEYITNANDKDLARLFTEDFAKAVHLSMVFQDGNTKTQLAGIKMFHIALSMGYVKRNILHEDATESEVKTISTPMAGFTATDTVQGGAFSTTAQVPVLRLYQFLTTFTVQSGPDKGKPVLDGNAVSDKDFIRAVMRADYSTAYQNCVKGKMRCVITLLSKAYFKDWKEYRTAAARSIGLTAESLAKYNVEKPFVSRLKELLPMIK
ncbi:hypothetical protein B5F34_12405 [Mediterranea sp. An20]|uniref:hypothetical protein n=1 Tax=Mediterranea sp. An20 TaxID=1965586 RepID=UPI000B39E3E2|nr:hypothetical protein [Mediterranea sp. An20]OUP07054.1 hypothetical protein B5F34_12405 [Mediterranea sp. An20]